MTGSSHTVFGQRKVELLHVLIFCLGDFNLTAAATALQPGVDMFLTLEKASLDFAYRFGGNNLHFGIATFHVIFRTDNILGILNFLCFVIIAVMGMFESVIATDGGEETEMLQVFYLH